MMLFALFSCKEKETDSDLMQVTFWTNETEQWNVYIDGKLFGNIKKPYYIGDITQIPQCGDDRFSSKMTTLGQHEYYMKLTIGPDTFISETHYFEVDGCSVVRIEQ
jgi:hypothetical protein